MAKGVYSFRQELSMRCPCSASAMSFVLMFAVGTSRLSSTACVFRFSKISSSFDLVWLDIFAIFSLEKHWPPGRQLRYSSMLEDGIGFKSARQAGEGAVGRHIGCAADVIRDD